MNSFDSQRQAPAECFKRRWPERRLGGGFTAPPPFSAPEEDVSGVIPAVTVVLEGRAICQRISLQNHASYESLAEALRGMFVEEDDGDEKAESPAGRRLDLSNAVPGHLVAYEDFENDLLLAGDLNWKDFVRVAKRIRILPVKANSRRGKGGV